MIKPKLLIAVEPCIKIFQFFGFADFHFSKRNSTEKKLSALWILIKYLLIITILSGLFFDSILGRINRLRDSNGVAIHLVIYVGTATEGFVSILQAFASSSKSLKFMRRLQRVDGILRKVLSININYHDLRRTLLTNVVLSLLVHFGCSAGVISLILWHNFHIWRLLIHFYVPILLGRIFVQRYIFMVQLLTLYLNIMKDSLEKSINSQPILVRKGDERRWKYNTRRNHFKVKVLKKTYRLLWEASCLLNKCFGSGLIVAFIMFCMTLLYQGYTICIDISKHQLNNRQFFNIGMTCYAIFSVHYYSQQSLRSVSFLINKHDSSEIYFLIDFEGEENNVPYSSADERCLIVILS